MASIPPSTHNLRPRTQNLTNVTESFKNTCGARAVAKSLGEYAAMESVRKPEITAHYASGSVVYTINGERMGPGHVSHNNSLHILY